MQDIGPFLFWVIAAGTAVCAIAVVVSQNIVRSATWLLFTLGGASGIFFLLGADFVGATQLLVYVGGTLVLVIFGVMLTAQGPFITMRTSAAEWAISTLVGLLLLGVLTVSALNSSAPQPIGVVKDYAPTKRLSAESPTKASAETNDIAPERDAQYSTAIGLGFLGIGVGPAHREGLNIVRMHYFLPFLIVSVHLLVVLIGAAYLARAKRRREAAQ